MRQQCSNHESLAELAPPADQGALEHIARVYLGRDTAALAPSDCMPPRKLWYGISLCLGQCVQGISHLN